MLRKTTIVTNNGTVIFVYKAGNLIFLILHIKTNIIMRSPWYCSIADALVPMRTTWCSQTRNYSEWFKWQHATKTIEPWLSSKRQCKERKIIHSFKTKQKTVSTNNQYISFRKQLGIVSDMVSTPPTKSLWTVLPAADSTLTWRLFQQVAVRNPLYVNQPNKFCFKGHILYC